MYLTWNRNVNDIILCLQIANHKLLSRFYVHIPSFFKMNPSDEVHEEHSDIKIEESEEIEVVSLDDIIDNQPRCLISISSKKGSLLNQELFLSITSFTESLREGEEPESLISISSNQSFQSITTSVSHKLAIWKFKPQMLDKKWLLAISKTQVSKKRISWLTKLTNWSCHLRMQ